ncbi:MAG: hypothetical protein ACPGPF_02035, partial [Pontibacterium sp.]
HPKDAHKNAFLWREKISDAELEALLEGYNLANLPDWYATQAQARASIVRRYAQLNTQQQNTHTQAMQNLMYTFE